MFYGLWGVYHGAPFFGIGDVGVEVRGGEGMRRWVEIRGYGGEGWGGWVVFGLGMGI